MQKQIWWKFAIFLLISSIFYRKDCTFWHCLVWEFSQGSFQSPAFSRLEFCSSLIFIIEKYTSWKTRKSVWSGSMNVTEGRNQPPILLWPLILINYSLLFKQEGRELFNSVKWLKLLINQTNSLPTKQKTYTVQYIS
jgi:hypothetical protein